MAAEDAAACEVRIRWPLAALSTLALSVVAMTPMPGGERAALSTLDAQRQDMARHGWIVSWSRASAWGGLIIRHATLRDVRISGVLDGKSVLYAADRLDISIDMLRPHRVSVAPEGAQAVALFARPSPGEAEGVLFAARITSDGAQLVLHRAASSDGAGGMDAAVTASNLALEIERSPVSSKLTVFGLGGLDARLASGNANGGLAGDISVKRLNLPVALPGLGKQVNGLRVAASIGGDESSPVVLLHLARGTIGPVNVRLSGRLVRGLDWTGDFDLVGVGLAAAVRRAAADGAASPDLAHVVSLLDRELADFQGSDVSAPPVTVAAAGDDGRQAAPAESGENGALISVPLRLRGGVWMLGAVPLADLSAAFDAKPPR
ncbi:hypothetical protein J2D73_17465 [Acetobacter sacchari]|uniref:DUF2125 domain-containing protein n=1 Tax=Acetobacter sacchari TaxID=2661687 RepID=A0ABS3M081_9PROT|nr:hypothetical protein [Acetobacter sacchari]MBO1361577.1 hypothetical protein [Acetobacter sacchari]